ncbi:conserved hypothetical protein [Desulfosarcina cetonica]|nr:conserved hypothetical protein [Desulfosarcina cetonica]
MHAEADDGFEAVAVGAARKPNSVPPDGYPAPGATIIPLGCRLPDTSSDLPGSSDGPPSSTPLFGLAPGGVYPASPVTRRTGALLPHRFTLTPPKARRFAFCCTCLHVTVTPRYGAPCPVVFGLSSSLVNDKASDRLVYSDRYAFSFSFQ